MEAKVEGDGQQHRQKPRKSEPFPIARKVRGHWTPMGCGPKDIQYNPKTIQIVD